MQGPLDLAAYQRASEAQRHKNGQLLADFETAIAHEGLPAHEVQRCLDDVRLFLDGYLLQQDDNALDMGCYLIDDFVEEFLVAQGEITPDDIERICEALLRFYGHLLEKTNIDEEDYEELDATIDAQLVEWKQACLHRNTSRPPTEMRDVVSLSMPFAGDLPDAGERSEKQDAIDRITLMLLYLLDQQSCEDAMERAVDRLQAEGLVDEHDSPNGKARPTSKGIEQAIRDLAALGLGR